MKEEIINELLKHNLYELIANKGYNANRDTLMRLIMELTYALEKAYMFKEEITQQTFEGIAEELRNHWGE